MVHRSIIVLVATLIAANPAQAELLQAIRPGIMCRAADALAKLSLPDGSSRTSGPTTSPAIEAIARAGGCVDFRAGNLVQLLTRRVQTSIVRSDTLTGDGVLDTFVVPNIDYAPFTPRKSEFDDALSALCPAKRDEITVSGMPTSGFVRTLPSPLRDAIDQAVDHECGGAPACSSARRYDEVARRRLVQRWAAYVCRTP